MSDWRDISTAPKDGSTVLLWAPDRAQPCHTGRWFETERFENGKLVWESKRWALDGAISLMDTDWQPTHWAPIIAPGDGPSATLAQLRDEIAAASAMADQATADLLDRTAKTAEGLRAISRAIAEIDAADVIRSFPEALRQYDESARQPSACAPDGLCETRIREIIREEIEAQLVNSEPFDGKSFESTPADRV